MKSVWEHGDHEDATILEFLQRPLFGIPPLLAYNKKSSHLSKQSSVYYPRSLETCSAGQNTKFRMFFSFQPKHVLPTFMTFPEASTQTAAEKCVRSVEP